MSKLLIGTCGYDYPKDWAEVFYQPRIRHDELLSYYAKHFNALELDFTYYSIPKAANIQACNNCRYVIYSVSWPQQRKLVRYKFKRPVQVPLHRW